MKPGTIGINTSISPEHYRMLQELIVEAMRETGQHTYQRDIIERALECYYQQQCPEEEKQS